MWTKSTMNWPWLAAAALALTVAALAGCADGEEASYAEIAAGQGGAARAGVGGAAGASGWSAAAGAGGASVAGAAGAGQAGAGQAGAGQAGAGQAGAGQPDGGTGGGGDAPCDGLVVTGAMREIAAPEGAPEELGVADPALMDLAGAGPTIVLSGGTIVSGNYQPSALGYAALPPWGSWPPAGSAAGKATFFHALPGDPTLPGALFGVAAVADGTFSLLAPSAPGDGPPSWILSLPLEVPLAAPFPATSLGAAAPGDAPLLVAQSEGTTLVGLKNPFRLQLIERATGVELWSQVVGDCGAVAADALPLPDGGYQLAWESLCGLSKVRIARLSLTGELSPISEVPLSSVGAVKLVPVQGGAWLLARSASAFSASIMRVLLTPDGTAPGGAEVVGKVTTYASNGEHIHAAPFRGGVLMLSSAGSSLALSWWRGPGDLVPEMLSIALPAIPGTLTSEIRSYALLPSADQRAVLLGWSRRGASVANGTPVSTPQRAEVVRVGCVAN
jgi:hypothetical protein